MILTNGRTFCFDIPAIKKLHASVPFGKNIEIVGNLTPLAPLQCNVKGNKGAMANQCKVGQLWWQRGNKTEIVVMIVTYL